jgi:predicted DNA binding CopG/RHH family protein
VREKRVLNFRVSEDLAREIEQRASGMGISVSEYLRFIARHEREVLREIETLKSQVARMETTISHINKLAFRAYRYGWFCAMALKEEQIKQVELKIEKELLDYENSINTGGKNDFKRQ